MRVYDTFVNHTNSARDSSEKPEVRWIWAWTDLERIARSGRQEKSLLQNCRTPINEVHDKLHSDSSSTKV